MVDLNDHVPGQTRVDPDDVNDLIPGHIRLLSELNEFEAMNIVRAQKKYLLARRQSLALDDTETLKTIHKDMFDLTWRWAGKFRTSNKNLGVDWWRVSEEIKKAGEDFKSWLENKVYPLAEIAIRFHHRLVFIHAFPNGNGRHARLVADIFLRGEGEKPLSWGAKQRLEEDPARKSYIQALKKADQGDFTDLIGFAES